MVIGNVVTQDKIRLNKKFNVVKDFSEIVDGVPTLIIGLDNAKLVSNSLNYIKRNIKEDLFWTFTKLERRTFFEEDLFYFIQYAYDKVKNPITYKFIDVIRFNDNQIKDVFEGFTLYSNITFYNDNMLYILSNKTIYGVDIRHVKYIGGDVDKLISKIKSISSVFLEDDGILIEYNNELGMFNDEVKYIPLLYLINNHD